MRKNLNLLVAVLFVMGLMSCVSSKEVYSDEYKEFLKTIEEEIKADTAEMEKNQTYLKNFSAKDKMGIYHDVIIYDDHYMKIDSVIYAYEFRNLMYYSLSLNLIGNIKSFEGMDKVWGIQGYAVPVSNSDLTVSFIIAKDTFGKKGYSSMYEAKQIDGVYFTGLNKDNGYIDDFGYCKSYGWTDYFEYIFSTTNKDVKKKMYIAIGKASN